MDSAEKERGIDCLSKELRQPQNDLAKLIAAVVRNKMEDFHGRHLSDAQMAELNPIIRNAIYTALVHVHENPLAMQAYGIAYVPDYWEDCELVEL